MLRDFESIRDLFSRKSKSAPENPTPSLPDTASGVSPDTTPASDRQLTKEQSDALRVLLVAAKQAEIVGDIARATKLYRTANTKLNEYLPLQDSEITKQIDTAYNKLTTATRERATTFGTTPLSLEKPPFPPELTKEHLEVLNSIFGKDNLTPSFFPTKESIYNETTKQTNPNYLKTYYPDPTDASIAPLITADEAKGLISKRPDWFKQQASLSVVGGTPDPKNATKSTELWQDAYTRSMAEYSKTHSGHLHFIETQLFEDNATFDPLLPFIQQACEVNGITKFNNSRFNLTHDEWLTICQHIQTHINTQLDTIPNNKIQVAIQPCPRVLANLQDSLITPNNSRSKKWWWAAEPLLKQDNTDSGDRLNGGDSDNGGAADLYRNHRDGRYDFLGARLSAMLFSKTEN